MSYCYNDISGFLSSWPPDLFRFVLDAFEVSLWIYNFVSSVILPDYFQEYIAHYSKRKVSVFVI